MISSLKYEATFAKTGRTLRADLKFNTGITAITGPNESGKSMIMEMIRWALFGSDALRGSSGDYESLRAELKFTVKGKNYVVNRTHNSGHLHCDDELLCSGTRPVTAKIVDTLGFGLDVFDISCAANQDSLNALGAMRPTERKRMVDKVIGSDKIEGVAKWAGEEALMTGRELTGMDKGLVAPTAPIRPQGYTSSTDLLRVIEILRQRHSDYYKKLGWLSSKPKEPIKPQPVNVKTPLENLLKAETLLQKHIYDFDLVQETNAWEEYDLWQARVEFDQKNPRPTMTEEEIEIENERAFLNTELKILRRSPELTCPCGKTFTAMDMQIADLEQRLADLPAPAHPDLDRIKEAANAARWNRPEVLQRWEQVKDARQVERPRISKSDIVRAEQPDAVKLKDFVVEMQMLILDHTVSLQTVRNMIREINTYEALEAAYVPTKAEYDAWVVKAAQVALELDDVREDIETLPEMEKQLVSWLTYEKEEQRYAQEVNAYEKKQTELEDLRRVRDSWIEVKTALNEIREEIKTHLVPSLSKHASILMGHMTGGARNSIVVDESFEVTVDGQPLATLSGSGQACANLALRIGLGQVLTNGMFSVFMGDELDASMDEDRAKNLQLSLVMLKDFILQIIIITHKIPEADHVIKLGA